MNSDKTNEARYSGNKSTINVTSIKYLLMLDWLFITGIFPNGTIQQCITIVMMLCIHDLTAKAEHMQFICCSST